MLLETVLLKLFCDSRDGVVERLLVILMIPKTMQPQVGQTWCLVAAASLPADKRFRLHIAWWSWF